MTKLQRLLLALASTLLLSIPFFKWGSGLLLFVAFVPLLWLEDEASRKKKEAKDSGQKARTGLMGLVILAFALWVLLTTYWVYWASWVGIVASLIVNTTYMSLTFWLFHYTRRKLGDRLGYASLPIFWLAFEFLYLRAQFNFPWILLGNGFANDVSLIQWYEWTGVLGGTLWVLLINLAVFFLLKNWIKNPGFTQNRRYLSRIVLFFIIPVTFSLVRFLSYEEKNDPYEIVVLQPNIDPYKKFTSMTQKDQTEILLHLADSLVSPKTEYIVTPETFINNRVWQSKMHQHSEIKRIYNFLDSFPDAKMVLGATTLKLYTEASEFTETSREIGRQGWHYDSFNSALQLDSSDHIPLYHKSILVAGVEHMPRAELFGFLEKLTLRLGGAMRSHGTQEYRETFASPKDSTRVGPVICWESVFGEHVTGYVADAGANFLFIITNDGWWKNTPGHRQHNAYAHIRAIECRRSVARSANTGISSLIDQRGVELQRAGWWERTGLRGELNSNDHLTFYVRHGDYLGRIAVLVTVILLLYSLVKPFIRLKKP